MKYRKAVPKGSVPKEAYQMVVEYDYGIGEEMAKKMEGVRRHGVAPQRWQQADAAAIGTKPKIL